jgi:hypothetical protein
MPDDENPYQPPSVPRESGAQPGPSRRGSIKRRVAAFFFALPLLLALPIRYWVFYVAGGWFVSTNLEPQHRAAELGLMYLALMLSIIILAAFSACVLLWMDRFYRLFFGLAAILLGILAIPAILFLAIGVQSYLKFG